MLAGSSSVVGGGRLILNIAFPTHAAAALVGRHRLSPLPADDARVRRASRRWLACRWACTCSGVPLSWLMAVASPRAWRCSSRRFRSTSATPRASCPTPCASGSTSRRCCGSPTRRPHGSQPFLPVNPLYGDHRWLDQVLIEGEPTRRPADAASAPRGRSAPWSSAACSSCPGSVSSLSASEPPARRPPGQGHPRSASRTSRVTYRTSFEARPTLKSALVALGRRRSVASARSRPSRTCPSTSPTAPCSASSAPTAPASPRSCAPSPGSCRPPQGAIEVHGRISTLLALGVGFNAQAHRPRERRPRWPRRRPEPRADRPRKYDEIAEFAELGDFMDLPMRTYSSGMYSRLAFSVAVNMDPTSSSSTRRSRPGTRSSGRSPPPRCASCALSARTMLLVSHALGTHQGACAPRRSGCTRAADACGRPRTTSSRPTRGSSRSARTRWSSRTSEPRAGGQPAPDVSS